jgi:hypothetical protein
MMLRIFAGEFDRYDYVMPSETPLYLQLFHLPLRVWVNDGRDVIVFDHGYLKLPEREFVATAILMEKPTRQLHDALLEAGFKMTSDYTPRTRRDIG